MQGFRESFKFDSSFHADISTFNPVIDDSTDDPKYSNARLNHYDDAHDAHDAHNDHDDHDDHEID